MNIVSIKTMKKGNMPKNDLFQHTIQIRELNYLAKKVVDKFEYVNQFMDTVPDVTREEQCTLADIHNLIDTIEEHKKVYQKSSYNYFNNYNYLEYRYLLKAAISLLMDLERRIVQNIPKICLN